MFEFFSTVFARPIFLAGAAAAVIPFIIHLAYHRRAPKVQFGALRFIRMSAERTARRRRIREWRLLFLRAILIILLAVGLAGPIVRTAKSGIPAKAAAIALVMDNSYSMATTFEGRSRFAAARDCALEILRGLSGEGQASVFYAWPTGRENLSEHLTADRNRLAEDLAGADISIVPGDIATAIHRAEKSLQAGPDDHHEMYILSDLHKATWRAIAPFEEKRKPITILVDCGTADIRNLAVISANIEVVRLAPGVPISVRGTLRSYSDREEYIAVSLHMDRQKVGERTIAINPDVGESAPTILTHQEIAAEMMPGREIHFARNAKEAREIASRIRQGMPLSPAVLFIVLALVVAECFMSNRKGKAPRR